MIKTLALLFILLISFQLKAAELMLTGGGSYERMNILGQNKVPTYQGNGVWGELEYLMPFSFKSALSLFATYRRSTLTNTYNESGIDEEVTLSYLGAGVKLWLNRVFLSASIGKLSFTDVATGEVEKDIESDERAYEFGIGYRIKLSRLFGLVVAVHALNASLHPENGSGFEDEYKIWNYRASLGLNFVLPSSPEEK